jgi:hypothetical protein
VVGVQKKQKKKVRYDNITELKQAILVQQPGEP